MEFIKNIREFVNKNQTTVGIFSLFIITISTYNSLISSPKNAITNYYFKIEKGDHLGKIAQKLKENEYIKSTEVFKIFTIILGGDKKIIAGDYLLFGDESVYQLAKRIITGNFQSISMKVTIPEGTSNKEISEILKSKLYSFDEKVFAEKTKNKEGYLFPDTYFFSPKADIDEIVTKMSSNFEVKLNKFEKDIEKSGKNLDDIIKMASILEGEAKTTEDRRIVSGILWKRIKMKIPLQVDATFKYINGKGTFDLTLYDLKIDSPYNTYKILGLPKTPINNPGEDAIYASLNPTETDYLYFLTGKDGKMYYSKTFEEHKIKKQKYLR